MRVPAILRRILHNSSWLAGEHLVRLGGGLVVTVLLARFLGPAEFGLLNYLLAIVGVFGVLASFGIETNVCRDLADETRPRERIVSAAIFLRGLAGVVSALACVAAVALLRPGESATIVLAVLLSLLLLLQAADSLVLPFQVELQSRVPVRVKLAVFLLFVVVKIVLVTAGFSVAAIVTAIVIEALCAALAMVVVYRLRFGRIGFAIERSYVRSLVKQSWPLLLASIGSMVYLRADMIMLAELSGEAEAGIYAAATKLSEAWYFMPMAFVASFQPFLVKARRAGLAQFSVYLRRLYALMAASSILVAICVSLLADWLVDLLYGEPYRDAANILIVHVWAALAVFLGVASSQYLVIEGKQRFSAYRALIGMCSNLLLNALLIPRYGGLGAAWATLISYALSVFSIAVFAELRAQGFMLLRALSPYEWALLLVQIRNLKA